MLIDTLYDNNLINSASCILYQQHDNYIKAVRKMLSNQELMSYIRNSYNEYKNNDAEFNNDIDSIIERRCTSENLRHTRRFNAIQPDNQRTIY